MRPALTDLWTHRSRTPASVDDLIGHTMESVELCKDSRDERGDILVFRSTDGWAILMGHDQDCCEDVWLEDVAGDLGDLVGSPILAAEESTKEDETAMESLTWTFYRLRTALGLVVLRWCGSSNGYYSEAVDMYKVNTSRE